MNFKNALSFYRDMYLANGDRIVAQFLKNRKFSSHKHQIQVASLLKEIYEETLDLVPARPLAQAIIRDELSSILALADPVSRKYIHTISDFMAHIVPYALIKRKRLQYDKTRAA